MTDSLEASLSPKLERRRYYVHTFQKKYALLFGFSLFTYSLILFGLAMLALYVIPVSELASPVQIEDRLIEERYIAGRQFQALAEMMWPALLAIIVGGAFFSILLTNRIAWPLYRLQQSTKELAQGNLGVRIKFRKHDELQELAKVTNEALENIEQAMLEIRDRAVIERQAVRQLAEAMRAHSASTAATSEQWDLALKEGDQIEAVFQRFRFSK